VSDPLSIGLVGCGRLAEAGYLPALDAARGVRLAAVADTDPTRRAAVAAGAGRRAGPARAAGACAGGVPAFSTLGELLEGSRVGAVVLATPAPTHLADAQLAARAHVATLVEKPPARDAAHAGALAALDPAPWVAFNRRFGAGQRAVRALLAQRTADDHGAGPGQRVELRIELRYRRASWGAHTVGDEALLDLGPHLVDLAGWLTDRQVIAVRAATLSHERAELELELEQGSATVRCAADRPHRELIEAHGPRGELLARHDEGGVAAGLLARLTARGRPHPLVASLTAQLEAFARAVGGEPEPDLASAADGHAVMAVLDAARACAADGRPVAVAVAA